MPRKPTGTVEYRDGRWKARVTLRDRARVWVDLSAEIPKNRRDLAKKEALRYSTWARENDAALVGEKVRGRIVPLQGESVAAWSDRWCAARERRGLRSVRNDRDRLRKHILPFLEGLPMPAVKPSHLEDIVTNLDSKIRTGTLSWRTAQNVWAIVSKMFADAKASKERSLRVRTDNPAADVAPPDRGTSKGKVYLWPSEFLALASCDTVPLIWRRLFAVAVYTYARAGEIAALEWADIDLEHGVLHIHQSLDYDTGKVKPTKTGETRRYRIEPALGPLLEAMKEEAGGKGRVFGTMPEKRDHADSLRAYLEAAGVTRAALFASDATRKNMTFHDLRSTGITWMAVRGDEPLKIKQRAGHRTFSTTEIYIREAENLREGFGQVFPKLPASLLNRPANVPPNDGSRGYGADSHDAADGDGAKAQQKATEASAASPSSPPPRTAERPREPKRFAGFRVSGGRYDPPG